MHKPTHTYPTNPSNPWELYIKSASEGKFRNPPANDAERMEREEILKKAFMHLTVQETEISPTHRLLEQLMQFDQQLQTIGSGAYSKLLTKYVAEDVKYVTTPTGAVKVKLLSKQEFIDKFKRRDLTSILADKTKTGYQSQVRLDTAYSPNSALTAYACKPR